MGNPPFSGLVINDPMVVKNAFFWCLKTRYRKNPKVGCILSRKLVMFEAHPIRHTHLIIGNALPSFAWSVQTLTFFWLPGFCGSKPQFVVASKPRFFLGQIPMFVARNCTFDGLMLSRTLCHHCWWLKVLNRQFLMVTNMSPLYPHYIPVPLNSLGITSRSLARPGWPWVQAMYRVTLEVHGLTMDLCTRSLEKYPWNYTKTRWFQFANITLVCAESLPTHIYIYIVCVKQSTSINYLSRFIQICIQC